MGIRRDDESRTHSLCQRCLESNAQEKKFRNNADIENILIPINTRLANKLGRRQQETFMIKSTSIDDASGKIGRNDPNFVVARLVLLRMSPNTTTNSITACNKLQSALAANTHLQILNIHMTVGFTNYEQAANAIAHGLAVNTSIKRVTLRISSTKARATTKTDCGTRSVKVALALRKMVESNTVMTSFRLRRLTNCGGPFGDMMESQIKGTENDVFVEPILQGLKRNTTLQVLRLDGYNRPRDKQRMDFLLACNREKWVERVANTNAPLKARVGALSEAMAFPKAEPVSTAYHLLRKCPDLIPPK